MQKQEMYMRNFWSFQFLVVKMIVFLQYEAVLELNPVPFKFYKWGGGRRPIFLKLYYVRDFYACIQFDIGE